MVRSDNSEAFGIPADLDGHEDIFTHPFVLLNDGAGRFTRSPYPPIPFSFRGGVLPPPLAVDLNGDGKPDLIALGSVLLGNGDGTFRPAVRLGVPLNILADFNGDGVLDAFDETVFLNHAVRTTRFDLNGNSVPDECQTRFHRGDPNFSGTTDISDSITVFGFLFLGDPASLSCKESADANNDGKIDISDGIYLLNWLFTGGPAPAAPGPTGSACGLDPDPTGSPADLGCGAYTQCN